ncbi:hypothetical protein Bca101_020369 [Brassica carinata]
MWQWRRRVEVSCEILPRNRIIRRYKNDVYGNGKGCNLGVIVSKPPTKVSRGPKMLVQREASSETLATANDLRPHKSEIMRAPSPMKRRRDSFRSERNRGQGEPPSRSRDPPPPKHRPFNRRIKPSPDD